MSWAVESPLLKGNVSWWALGEGGWKKAEAGDVRVLVGVVFLGQLAVGRLDLLVRGLLVDTEDLVVILNTQRKLR